MFLTARAASVVNCAQIVRSTRMTDDMTFGREICGDLEQSLRREWLVTNGLGAYGAGTLAGCQTRRYHGLLGGSGKAARGSRHVVGRPRCHRARGRP